MSVNYTAWAAVGIVVNETALCRTESVPSCGHAVRKTSDGIDHKFCPECGKKVGVKTITHPIEGYEEHDDTLLRVGDTVFGVLRTNDDDRAIISWRHTENADEENHLQRLHIRHHLNTIGVGIDGVEKEMREKLEPLGLWNDTFGIWVGLDCSY